MTLPKLSEFPHGSIPSPRNGKTRPRAAIAVMTQAAGTTKVGRHWRPALGETLVTALVVAVWRCTPPVSTARDSLQACLPARGAEGVDPRLRSHPPTQLTTKPPRLRDVQEDHDGNWQLAANIAFRIQVAPDINPHWSATRTAR